MEAQRGQNGVERGQSGGRARAERGQNGGRTRAEWGQNEGRVGVERGQNGAERGQNEGKMGVKRGQSGGRTMAERWRCEDRVGAEQGQNGSRGMSCLAPPSFPQRPPLGGTHCPSRGAAQTEVVQSSLVSGVSVIATAALSHLKHIVPFQGAVGHNERISGLRMPLYT